MTGEEAEQVSNDPTGQDTRLCHTEGCGKERSWKGLCRSCYGQALRLISDGKTTWDELTEMGLVVMDDKPFIAAFRRKKVELEKETSDGKA